MQKFIAQKDEFCSDCGCELPTGSWFYTDGFGSCRCEECQENEMLGETYG